jgi:hypothetical protein
MKSRLIAMLMALWLIAMPAQSLAQTSTLTAEIQAIHIRDDGSRSPYSTLTFTVNETKAVYIYASFTGFGDGKQVDFQPSGSGWRTVLMCCDLVEPIVYVWTQDNDGNVLSTWTNAVLANQVFLPVVIR